MTSLRALSASLALCAACGGHDRSHAAGGGNGAAGTSQGLAGASESAGASATKSSTASGGGSAAGRNGAGQAGANAMLHATGGTNASASGGRAANASGGDGAGGSVAASGAGAAGRAGESGGGACTDACPAKNGVTVGCEKRFMFGVNYAWINWAEDFGGGSNGVAANRANVRTQMQDMKQNGVDVIRWWMHPVFTTSAVSFDNGNPSGLGGSELDDIDAALSLAAEVGLHLKLTLFSFDNFRSDSQTGHSLTPILSDPTREKTLIDNVVRPIARAVASNANAARMISWDIINEPEWAISGNDGLGDQDFDPNTDLTAVSYPVMKSFVSDAAAALHAESSALVTVGQAAVKWSHAFTGAGLDYYDMHYYGWVDQYFPLGSKSLSDYGIGDKPVVVGEFPLDGWTNPNGTLTASQIVQKLFDLGYSGAKAWAFTQDGNWSGNKANLASFATANSCVVQY